MIQKMQSIECLQPGPIGEEQTQGRLFTYYSPRPFKSAAEMEAWFNHRPEIARGVQGIFQAPEDIQSFSFSKVCCNKP